MHATGIGVNSSQAKALVYNMFAALGGNLKAQMAMVRALFEKNWFGTTLTHPVPMINRIPNVDLKELC